MVSWGVLYYSFAVLLTPMKASFGVSTLELTGAFSLALAISGLTGMAVGRWLDEHSPRSVMSVGSITAALLVLAWSRVESLLGIYLVFAGIGVVMAAVLYEPAFIVVTKWFRVRRREALTVVTLVGALASFVFSPLTERLATSYGWRDALVVLALVLGAVTLPLHAFVLRPGPARARQDERPPVGISRRRSTLPGFPLLTMAFVLGAFTTSAVSIHLVALLIGAGHSSAFAATIAGLAGISQIPGRIAFAALGNVLPAGRLAAAVFGAAALALILLALGRSPAVVVAFALLFGISGGMMTLLRAALVGDLYGSASYGRTLGTASAFVSGAKAVAPFAAAALALLPGGYTTVSWLLAAASALAGLAAARAVAEAGAVGGTAAAPARVLG
jgi:predicted MFS family arabinose efflux permease